MPDAFYSFQLTIIVHHHKLMLQKYLESARRVTREVLLDFWT
jgi:hypothetical protein